MGVTRERRPLRRMFSAFTTLALLAGMLVLWVPSASASLTPCRVTNLTTKHTYYGTGSNLQTAIDAAAPEPT